MGLGILNRGALIKMGTIIIIGVTIAFLTAIFTAGYNDKPGTK